MDWMLPAALRIIAAVALTYFGLGLFNITWPMRVRAIAALAIGAAMLGAGGWPLVRPEDPEAAITLVNCPMTISAALLCLLLAFGAGFAAYFAAWPAGKIFAPYAAPTGMAVWAMHSGSMHQLLMYHHDLPQRQALYSALRWEGLFWLLVCAAGYLGVLAASKLAGAKIVILGTYNSQKPKGAGLWGNAALALAAAVAIGWVAIGVLVQDIHHPDPQLGSVVGQPGNRQIAFGVFAAFCLAGYLVKYGLKIGYLPVAAASAALTFAATTQLLSGDTLAHLAGAWPAAYFTHAVNAITPLQMTAFAWLGAVTGYWMAVKFHHQQWQQH